MKNVSILLVSDASNDLFKISKVLVKTLSLMGFSSKALLKEPNLPQFDLFTSSIIASKSPVFDASSEKYNAVIVFNQSILNVFDPLKHLTRSSVLIINTGEDLSKISSLNQTVCLNIVRMIKEGYYEEGLISGLCAVLRILNFRKYIECLIQLGYSNEIIKNLENIYEVVRKEVLNIG